MTIRRRSSANSNPSGSSSGSSSGVNGASSSGPNPNKRGKRSLPRTVKASHSSPRTLTLQAARSQILTDPTLEELLQIKPPSVAQEEDASRGQATVERVEEAKEALGKLESEILSALFPSTGLPASLEEIAQRLGMTVTEVREVSDNALRGLRGTKSSRPRLSTVWN